MSDLRLRILALVLLCACGVLLLLPSLGTGELEMYDEGLYGMFAQNALHYDVWLHPVDTAGHFPIGRVKFSKPPLSIWVVAGMIRWLGPSLFAMRLPFAIASLVVACVALAWGRLLAAGPRGTWLGFAWGLSWLLTNGVSHWGRTATIEPLLLAFVMLALYSHARALRCAANGCRLRCVGAQARGSPSLAHS